MIGAILPQLPAPATLDLHDNGPVTPDSTATLLRALSALGPGENFSVNVWGLPIRSADLRFVTSVLENKVEKLTPQRVPVLKAVLMSMDIPELDLEGIVGGDLSILLPLLRTAAEVENFELNVWGFPMAKDDCVLVSELLRDRDEVDLIYIASQLGSRHPELSGRVKQHLDDHRHAA